MCFESATPVVSVWGVDTLVAKVEALSSFFGRARWGVDETCKSDVCVLTLMDFVLVFVGTHVTPEPTDLDTYIQTKWPWVHLWEDRRARRVLPCPGTGGMDIYGGGYGSPDTPGVVCISGPPTCASKCIQELLNGPVPVGCVLVPDVYKDTVVIRGAEVAVRTYKWDGPTAATPGATTGGDAPAAACEECTADGDNNSMIKVPIEFFVASMCGIEIENADTGYKYKQAGSLPTAPVPRDRCVSWYLQNREAILTQIASAKKMEQGSKAWLLARQSIFTASKFYLFGRPSGGGGVGERTQELLTRAHHIRYGTPIPNVSSVFTRHGTSHERDNVDMVMQALRTGSIVLEQVPKPKTTFVQYTHLGLQGRPAVREVTEDTSSPGLHIDRHTCVLGCSYDALLTVEGVGQVLVEAKCLKSMSGYVKPEHYAQVVGMLGILNDNGAHIAYAVYSIWKPTHSRFFVIPYDPYEWTTLRAALVTRWWQEFLPLVAGEV